MLGEAILRGWESSCAEAKYQAARGMFLLLMATRPKFCPFKGPREFDRESNAGKCSPDAAYACDTLACLNMPSKLR